MPRQVVEVGEWLPDLPTFANPGSIKVRNCLPRTKASYGPMPGFAQYATAPLNSRCQGAVAALDSAGNVWVIAGTATKLYEIGTGVTTFTDKSDIAYSIAADAFWNFALFNQLLIATDFADPMKVWTLAAGGNFATLAAAAPKAKYIAVVKNFLMAAFTNDGVNGICPQRAWWSALGDPTNWPTPGTAGALAVQSDYQDVIGPHGWCQGIVGNLGTADGAMFFEHAVWRILYQGAGVVFGFYPAEGARGTPAPGSIIQLGALVYYLGEDGFYAFDGTNSQPIGADKIDKTFFADLDYSNVRRICAAIDPVNRLVLWAYPGAGNSGGNPNHLLIYNWILDRWSIVDLTVEWIIRFLTFGYTLDQLNAFGAIDVLPYGLDSRAWTGGNLLLGGFDATHTMGYFNGAPLAPTIDTKEAQLFPGKRAFVKSARPLVDGSSPSIKVIGRNRLTDALTNGPVVAQNGIGECPQRANWRYVRGELTLPAGDATWTNIVGMEVDAVPAGIR